MNTPQHVVIVPDGNRRWAKAKGKPTFKGHIEGDKTFHKILETALDLKIPYVTAWGSSVSNITERSKTEVAILFGIFEKGFKDLLRHEVVKKNKIKVRVFGRWQELFPKKVQAPIHKIVEATKNNNGYNLTFLLAYDGRDEMLSAAESLVASGKKKPTREDLKNSLWSKDLPPVDLVIRTGGEPHWSAGMMMWDVAEARLYFTKTLWPDFSSAEFKDAINGFSSIERRFGK